MLGAYATSKLSPLLSNTFTVPGTDSNTVRNVLEEHFGDRPDGSVDYPRAYEVALSGRGTGVLTVDLDSLHHR